MVERRLSRRSKQPVDVAVRTRSGTASIYTCRNWTTEGLFIVAAGLGLEVNDVIWVSAVADFVTPRGPSMLGIVVHRTADGVGVMLREPLPPARSFLPARV